MPYLVNLKFQKMRDTGQRLGQNDRGGITSRGFEFKDSIH
ncbi:hypothetical protein LINGRAHAP2_LOCUS23689 [Linum grandiflorum]